MPIFPEWISYQSLSKLMFQGVISACFSEKSKHSSLVAAKETEPINHYVLQQYQLQSGQ